MMHASVDKKAFLDLSQRGKILMIWCWLQSSLPHFQSNHLKIQFNLKKLGCQTLLGWTHHKLSFSFFPSLSFALNLHTHLQTHTNTRKRDQNDGGWWRKPKFKTSRRWRAILESISCIIKGMCWPVRKVTHTSRHQTRRIPRQERRDGQVRVCVREREKMCEQALKIGVNYYIFLRIEIKLERVWLFFLPRVQFLFLGGSKKSCKIVICVKRSNFNFLRPVFNYKKPWLV